MLIIKMSVASGVLSLFAGPALRMLTGYQPEDDPAFVLASWLSIMIAWSILNYLVHEAGENALNRLSYEAAREARQLQEEHDRIQSAAYNRGVRDGGMAARATVGGPTTVPADPPTTKRRRRKGTSASTPSTSRMALLMDDAE